MEPDYDVPNVDKWISPATYYLVWNKVIHFAPVPKIVFDLWYVPSHFQPGLQQVPLVG